MSGVVTGADAGAGDTGGDATATRAFVRAETTAALFD